MTIPLPRISTSFFPTSLADSNGSRAVAITSSTIPAFSAWSRPTTLSPIPKCTRPVPILDRAGMADYQRIDMVYARRPSWGRSCVSPIGTVESASASGTTHGGARTEKQNDQPGRGDSQRLADSWKRGFTGHEPGSLLAYPHEWMRL